MTIPRIQSYPQPCSMPSNRVNWQPDPARAALLIHDMQQYFLDFYDLAAAPIPDLLANTLQLRNACDDAGIPVYYTAQPAQQTAAQRGLLQDWWGPGITERPERAAVVPELAPRAQDTVLEKWRYSAFVRSDFLQRLQQSGRDQLIICGVYAHIGCLQTAADAFMHDIQPFLIGDAVADFSAEQQQMGLDYVAQRCGVVLNLAQVLAALAPKPREPGLPASRAELREQLASLLQLTPQDFNDDDNLLYLGLDSVRLMHLLERWRRAGANLSFVDLAEQPAINAWWTLLERSRA